MLSHRLRRGRCTGGPTCLDSICFFRRRSKGHVGRSSSQDYPKINPPPPCPPNSKLAGCNQSALTITTYTSLLPSFVLTDRGGGYMKTDRLPRPLQQGRLQLHMLYLCWPSPKSTVNIPQHLYNAAVTCMCVGVCVTASAHMARCVDNGSETTTLTSFAHQSMETINSCVTRSRTRKPPLLSHFSQMNGEKRKDDCAWL